MSRERTVFLRHVLLCLDKIERYTADGKQAFMRDAKTQDAVVRNLEIIGQPVKDLGTDDLSIRHPAIPWRQIAGLRNVLAHQYLGVDLALVWQVVEDHLSELRQAVATELSSITPKG